MHDALHPLQVAYFIYVGPDVPNQAYLDSQGGIVAPLRDAKLLNIPITFDPKRLMANTRVARSTRDGKLHIAFQVKEAWNLYELFHVRPFVLSE